MATGTAGTTARRSPLQMVHYLRMVINYNDAGISSGVGKQYLPAGAIIIGTDVYVNTVFNAATTNVVTVGTNSSSYNNIVAAADADETATGLTQNIKPTGTALGPLSADAQVFAKYDQTGTAATTGKCYVIIKYVVDNDL
jgi:hypothetical protein